MKPTLSLSYQILALVLTYFLAVWFTRWNLYGIKHYRLNKSAYRKVMKKRETLKEWFLYTRFRVIIPKPFLTAYFVVVIIYPVAMAICILSHLLHPESVLGTIVARTVGYSTFIWMFIMHVWPGNNYGRWMTKNIDKQYRYWETDQNEETYKTADNDSGETEDQKPTTKKAKTKKKGKNKK